MWSAAEYARATGLVGSWITFVLPVVTKASLLLGLVALVNLAMRRASASTRHLLWTLGFVGVLLLPIFQTGLP